MKKYFSIIGLMFVLLGSESISAQGIEFNHELTFQEALDKAKKEGRLVFIDCYTSWCGPCKRLAAQVFPDPEVGALFNKNFVNVKFDMEQGEGPTIATQYQIRAYPTLLWIDPNGSIKNKVVGGLDPAGLIEAGKKAVDQMPALMAGMDAKYASGNRELPFLEDYLKAMSSSGKDHKKVYDEYIKQLQPSDINKETTLKTMFELTKDLSSPALEFVTKHKAEVSAKVGQELFDKRINTIATNGVSGAIKKKSEEMFRQSMSVMKLSSAKDAKKEMAKLEMDYYLNTSTAPTYDRYVSNYIKQYAAKDDKVLNDVAWTYYINTIDDKYLKKAKDWAYKAVNIKNTSTNNTTYAYLQYKLGNMSEAVKACDYAIIKAKEENVAPKAAEALKAAIKKDTASK